MINFKSFKKKILPISTFVRIDVKRAFRDKVAIFFIFIFPLIFLFVFGGIFGKDNDISFKIAIINQSESQFSTDFVKNLEKDKIFKIDKEITNIDQAKAKMNRSELDATITLPENFGQPNKAGLPSGKASVLYDQNNQQGGQTLAAVLDSVFKGINSEITKTQPPFSVESKSTATKGLSKFDFIFSGLLGFSILSLGIFGPTSVFPRNKQKGVLKRYHSTSISVWQYFTGNVISNAFIGILSVGLMFVVSLLIFNLNMRGDYLSLVVLVALGTVTLFGVGLAIGGWAKNENQAAPLANLITFPMMFLSGTFFPRFLMPEWLQNVSGLLPLTPVIDGARMIITEGKTLLDLGPQVGLLVLWSIIIYTIAFKVFRWE